MKYSDEVVARIKDLRSQGYSWAQVAETLTRETGVEYNAGNLRKWFWRYGDKKGQVVYEDKKPEPTIEDVEQYWQAIIKMQQVADKLSLVQHTATVAIDDDRPVAVAFWGDWHLGGIGVDHARFLRDRELIRSTPGLYFIGMGDYKDNFMQSGHFGAVYHQVIPPGAQDILVLDTVRYVAEKALAWIKGNHDDWSAQIDGYDDFMTTICTTAKSVYLGHGGVIYLTVGDVVYKIGARHKYIYESSLNTTNSQRRLNEAFGGCDVIALAHTHQMDLHQKEHMGRGTVWIRSGTYKVEDDYAQSIGGWRGQYGVPLVILWPDRKEILPVYDFERGIEILHYYREARGREAG